MNLWFNDMDAYATAIESERSKPPTHGYTQREDHLLRRLSDFLADFGLG